MIQTLVIIVVVILIGGILLMSGQSSGRRKTREELKTLIEKFVNAKFEPIPGYENSYQVKFTYDGKTCIYEDYETKGFHDKIHKAYLKIPTPTKLNIQFTEKRYERVVGNRPMMASDMMKDVKTPARVQIPKELSMFTISTNDAEMTNEIFDDWRSKRVFVEFKNIDAQGRPSNSLKVLDGEIILEFHASGLSHPKSLDFESNMGVLETYIKKLLIIRNTIDSSIK